jgi:hypothetical protein
MHIPYYKLVRKQALAEVDYKTLGRGETGASDHRDNLEEGQHNPYIRACD